MSHYSLELATNFLARNPRLAILAQELDLAIASQQQAPDPLIQTLGIALYESLTDKAALLESYEASGINTWSVEVRSDDPLALALPWETLVLPGKESLGTLKGVSLTRKAQFKRTPPAVEKGPLRVLLFSAMPDNMHESGRLAVEQEQAWVQEALMEQERQGLVVLHMPEEGSFVGFQQALEEIKPHVLYLSGHGDLLPDAKNKAPCGHFFFEHDTQLGEPLPVNDQDLAACFRGIPVQLVILSACKSAKSDAGQPERSLAYALHKAGVPHVIGMRESVSDLAAAHFARHLLAQLTRKEPVASALQTARQCMKAGDTAIWRDMHGEPAIPQAKAQWYLPQLYSHALDGPLLDWSFTPVPKTHLTMSGLSNSTQPLDLFIGRRRDFQTLRHVLPNKPHGTTACLLLKGEGGKGKTALARKILGNWRKQAYYTLELPLRPEDNWRGALQDAILQDPALTSALKQWQTFNPSEDEHAMLVQSLEVIWQIHQGKVALLFDNLESLQEPMAPHALADAGLAALLGKALVLAQHGMVVLGTSRWHEPTWPNRYTKDLPQPPYTDFVAWVRHKNLGLTSERMRQCFNALGGNYVAANYFALAAKNMAPADEQAFLTELKNAEHHAQTHMALDKLLVNLTPQAQQLLYCMLAYTVPVSEDGAAAVWPLTAVAAPREREKAVFDAMEQLWQVSLLESSPNQDGQTEFELVPLVRSWLQQHEDAALSIEVKVAAAEYLWWRLEVDQSTNWFRLLATHAALRTADLTAKANRLVLDWIVGRLSLAGDYKSLLTTWLMPLLGDADPVVRGEALGQAGKQYIHIGDYEHAMQLLTQSLAIQQTIGDKAGEGRTLNNISQIYDARGEHETALQLLERSLAIRQAIGDRSGEGVTLNNISQIYFSRGDCEKALQLLEQSLAIQQETGGKELEGVLLNNISKIHEAKGDNEKALQLLEQSLAIRQAIGDEAGEGATLNNISQIYKARAEYEKALRWLEQSLAIQQAIGDKAGEVATLNNISEIYKIRGDYEKTLQWLGQSLAIRQAIGDKAGASTTLNNMGTAAYALGDYEKALHWLKRSLAIKQAIGDLAGQNAILINIGHNYFKKNDLERAVRYWVDAYRLAQSHGFAQALAALEKLASQIGLPGGLNGWAALAESM